MKGFWLPAVVDEKLPFLHPLPEVVYACNLSGISCQWYVPYQ